MKSRKVLAVIVLCCTLCQLSWMVDGGCVCNEKGTDYCEACSGNRIVRPVQKYYDSNTDLDLSPIGDNCWCSKLMIEPAALPKPPCPKHKTEKCSCKSSYSYGDSKPSSSYSVPYSSPSVSYDYAKGKDDSAPADPISVSLAIQAGKAIEVPEAKLAYGFVQKPVDGLKKVYFSSVPEENLFKLKSDVITLKKRPQYVQKEEDDAYEEEEEETTPDDDEKPYLSYKELGYVTEKFKNPKFRKVSSSYVYADEYEKPVSGGKVKVDCGYKPGRVSPYRKINTRSDTNDCFENA